VSDLYDTDILLWSEQQAARLRRLASGEHVNEAVDWENLAEEIEALGKSPARELASRIATILEHLCKLAASPAVEPRAGWRATIRRERREIDRLLADAPSLRPTIAAVIAAELPGARDAVQEDLADRRETPAVEMAGLSFMPDQVLGTWLPA
jgi:Domain of unknown function DUF29